MNNKKSRLSHIEINVIDYTKSIIFYDTVLIPIGFERTNCTTDFTAYSDGVSKLILCPTKDKYKELGFHRQKPGLNHLAFYADSKQSVDIFHKEVLLKNNIGTLYADMPTGNDEYYAVFFEDPDRLKLELVYAPKYCDLKCWPSNIEDNFDPYSN